jgi:hypothetical protein
MILPTTRHSRTHHASLLLGSHTRHKWWKPTTLLSEQRVRSASSPSAYTTTCAALMTVHATHLTCSCWLHETLGCTGWRSISGTSSGARLECCGWAARGSLGGRGCRGCACCCHNNRCGVQCHGAGSVLERAADVPLLHHLQGIHHRHVSRQCSKPHAGTTQAIQQVKAAQQLPRVPWGCCSGSWMQGAWTCCPPHPAAT